MLQYTSWQNKLDALQNKIDKNNEMYEYITSITKQTNQLRFHFHFKYYRSSNHQIKNNLRSLK